ncbi:MAG: orotate phosphoribosyltransferase [Desulfovermiculus sp.]|nr:orotate phosphoribosyltransferase [Desulfovermiculus sp.]
MNDPLSRLAGYLLDRSYIPGRVTLTSGRVSDYYFDCKQTALHPEGGYLLGLILLRSLKDSVQAVGGMTLGADPLVSAVSVLSHIHNCPLPGFIVRKTSKGHGTNQYLEGLANIPQGAKVAVLEDVVTSGGSVLTACQRTVQAGLHIEQVLTVLDRQEGGAEALAEEGYTLESVFTKKSLFAAAGKDV